MDWKAILATVAPTLATAAGGPLAGVAVQAIAKALGLPESTQEAVEQAVAGATPETLLALKQADLEFQKAMRALDIDVLRIDAGDRDSARKMQIETNSRIPGSLAFAVTAGFYGVLLWLLCYGMPPSGGEALLLLLGSLGTAWTGVVAYYFGSSAGSARKDALLAKGSNG
jgi:hypothetical protein